LISIKADIAGQSRYVATRVDGAFLGENWLRIAAGRRVVLKRRCPNVPKLP
jgi:hypothetical protein